MTESQTLWVVRCLRPFFAGEKPINHTRWFTLKESADAYVDEMKRRGIEVKFYGEYTLVRENEC